MMIRKVLGNIVLLAIPTLIIVLYYKFYLTTGNVWSVQCTFHDVTGWQCPGCGGQRAFYYLLHGEVLMALRHNILILLLLPLLLFCYFVLGQIYIVGNKQFERYLKFKTWHAYFFIGLLLLFLLLRNIPSFPFYLLSPP